MFGGQMALRRAVRPAGSSLAGATSRGVSASPVASTATAAAASSGTSAASAAVAATAPTSHGLRSRHHAAALLGKRAGARLASRLGVRANHMANLALAPSSSTPQSRWAYGQELHDYYSKCYLPAMRAQIAALVDLQRREAFRSTEQLARGILPPGVPTTVAGAGPSMAAALGAVQVGGGAAAAADAAIDVVTASTAAVAKKKPVPRVNTRPRIAPVTQEMLDAADNVQDFIRLLVPNIKSRRSQAMREKMLQRKREVFEADVDDISAQTLVDTMRLLAISTEWRAVCDLFWRGHDLGRLTPAAHLLCIQAASMSDNERLARVAYSQLRASGKFVSQQSYLHAFRAMSKLRSTAAARVLVDMTEAGFPPRDRMFRQCLYSLNNASRKDADAEIVALFDCMLDRDIKPTTRSLSVVFKAYHSDLPEHAPRIARAWNAAVAAGLKPPVHWFGVMLSACRVTRDAAEAQRVMELALECGGNNVVTYSTALSVLVTSGNMASCLALYQSMRRAGVVPNEHIISTLLKIVALAPRQEQDRLLTFAVNEAITHQVELGEHFMYGIVSAYVNSDSSGLGVAVAQQLVRRLAPLCGVEANPHIHWCLVKGLLVSSHVQAAVSEVRMMLASCPPHLLLPHAPGPSRLKVRNVFQLLVDKAANRRNWGVVAECDQLMQLHSVEQTYETLHHIVHAHLEFGDLDAAESALARARQVQLRRKPDRAMLHYMRRLRRARMRAAAVEEDAHADEVFDDDDPPELR